MFRRHLCPGSACAPAPWPPDHPPPSPLGYPRHVPPLRSLQEPLTPRLFRRPSIFLDYSRRPQNKKPKAFASGSLLGNILAFLGLDHPAFHDLFIAQPEIRNI